MYTHNPVICLRQPQRKNIALKEIFLEKKSLEVNVKIGKMCNAMQYIENFPTLWPKDNDKFFFICPSILQLENHVGMR